MDVEALRALWKQEEGAAQIHGWDFSHIRGRYEEEGDLPWDYGAIVQSHLRAETRVLDYDTGGGEFLLSLGHPYHLTWATEGYPPNVALCRQRLTPLGVHFRACRDASAIPFEDGSFDVILNRHGDFHPPELYRLLGKGGVVVTEQVGGENDRDLVELVLPGLEPPFPHLRLETQRAAFQRAGFQILRAEEAFRPISFYDVGAFVWFARIIQWEFPGFSVDRCWEGLLKMQRMVERDGKVTGTIHRYLITAKKQ